MRTKRIMCKGFFLRGGHEEVGSITSDNVKRERETAGGKFTLRGIQTLGPCHTINAV